MNAENSIKILLYYINGLNTQSFQHKVQGKIFASQGLSKLGDKYCEHSVEENGWVEKMIDRVLDLGGNFTEVSAEKMPIYNNIVDYLKADADVSASGIEQLRKDMKSVAEDITTYDILKDYLKDEEEDANWTDLQLQLIKTIGLDNWLTKQL